MGRRTKWLMIAAALLLLGLGIWRWTKREKPSYESRFAEYVWIEYPAGFPLEAREFGGTQIDELLRERKIGYLGGVTSKGDPPEVVEVELAVDLEELEAKALVEELMEMGLLPKEAKFEAGTYPRAW